MDVTFRFRGDARRIVLLGETTDWRGGVPLASADDGFAATLDLPPNVYQHKLLVDGRWTLDGSGRTRSAGGQRNDLACPGAAPEPWLFAPAAPWIVPLARGGVRVLVGVRRTTAPVVDAPTLRHREREDAPWQTVPLEHAFDEDEHAFFVGHAPVSAAHVTFALGAWETTWARPPAADRPPGWWPDAAIYGIFVDRFRPAIDHDGFGVDPGKGRAAGGHLDGIRRSLGAIQELGFDTVYLTPVHVGASVHRYDVVDPTTVDPALGGEKAYAELAAAAAERGMRIVQDVSFAHAGRGFPAFEDVLVRGRGSRWAPWFQWDAGGLVHYGERTDAPLFDLENAEVQALVLDAVTAYARRGAKGLRLDMTAEVPLALGARIRQRFRALVPDGVVFGELVPQHAWRWHAAGVVDAATDFGFHAAVTALTCNIHASATDAFAAIARSELLRGDEPRTAAVRFLSTHDHPRLATLAAHAGTLERVPLATTLLATLPGVPMLLYGEEVGMRSDGAGLATEDVWPDRAPMPWSGPRRDEAMRALVQSLFRMRRDSEALRSGTLTLLFADATTLVYRREAEGEVVDVALSFDAAPKVLALEDDELPRVVPLVSVGTATLDREVLTLGPFAALVMRRERLLGRAVAPPLARRNLVLRDQDLRDGAISARARPSRLFFSVTERCNLRCAHCITHAPELTASGAARTMTANVVDALAADLALADYFAFVHGGESLTAPVLFDLLRAIADARGNEPTVAHLLTNGLLLSPAVAARLHAAGVSSIAVSLDGATRQTNDAIRLGGRFDDVTRRIEDVVSWRRGEGIDLRIGLSFVVLAQNVHELEAFVDLGARLGVDWIKLEEGVPATAFAKRSLVGCGAPDVRASIARAVARGRAAGLVMVDHTFDRAIWRCRLDDDTRAFLEADEFANRGTIHPCRVPWETACIEPNGDVRVVDFYGPILGNVTKTPLRDLWNARDAMDARTRSLRARVCGAGPVTCVE